MESFDYVLEDYLNIGEKAKYETGVDRVSYLSVDPQIGATFRNGETTTFTIEKGDKWLLPSKSYLYIEGRLTKADGTPYTRTPQGDYPDITFVNNGIMYLYQSLSYYIDNIQVESFTYPGYATLMSALMSKPASFTGLDQCWSIDNYDGGVDLDRLYYPMANFTLADFPTAAETPTKVEYRNIIRAFIARFNITNKTNIVLADDDIPCVGDTPTLAEVRTVFRTLIDKINLAIVAPDIPYLTDAEVIGIKTSEIIQTMYTAITKINSTIVNTDVFLTQNDGFIQRKRILFNPFIKVQPEGNSGYFSFRIPLDFIFSFCADFTEVIYYKKHELKLQREVTDLAALLRGNTIDAGKVSITNMKWYVPQIYPSLNAQLVLNNKILSMPYTDIAYREKSIQTFTVTPGTKNFSASLSYTGGIKKPRFIIAGFQYLPIGVSQDLLNTAIFNNPKYDTNKMINVVDAVLYVDSSQNTLGYNNDFTLHRDSKWYNDYKNARAVLTGDFDETNCVDFYNFVNLYRLYIFDTKEKVDFKSGASNVKIDFNFKDVIPQITDGETKLYILSFTDNLIKLPNNGIESVIRMK